MTIIVSPNTPPLSLPEAARTLGVSDDTIRRWIRAGQLPAFRVGPAGHYRIATQDLAHLVENRR